jgi:hypothetical protein
MQVIPLFEVMAILVKDLDSMVFPVCHIHFSVFAAYAMGQVELARIASRSAPGQEMLSFGRELMDACVAIAIGDIYFSGF